MSFLAEAKDPAADLDYTIDWTLWLKTDTISTSAWTAPAGITLHTGTIDPTSKKTTIWASGGVAGKSYILVNRIVTNGGRTDERSLEIPIKDN